jgi:hypothetical protein
MPAPAFCQEEGPPPDLESQMHHQRIELQMEQQRADAEFQREMQSLELEARRLELDQARRDHGGGAALLLILCGVVRILVATWIYQDIRLRNAGSGLWIVLGLIGGLLAALVYAVVRLGDTKSAAKRTDSQ